MVCMSYFLFVCEVVVVVVVVVWVWVCVCAPSLLRCRFFQVTTDP